MSEDSASEVVDERVEITSNEELSSVPTEKSTQGEDPQTSQETKDNTQKNDPETSESTENGVKDDRGSKADVEPSKAAPSRPKYRHDWYQTASDVYVNVMIKKLTKDQVHVQFEDTTLLVSIDLEGDGYSLELRLAHPVDPAKCSCKVLSTKVELKLRKREMIQWSSLEDKGEAKVQVISSATPAKEEVVHKYPSSAHYSRNWDKIVADVKKEEKEEKPEGDAALNKLFQQIYADGSDEVKKAMNKSFQESGGTVLSTNWGEIGQGKVERKPPDGMEWKEYEK